MARPGELDKKSSHSVDRLGVIQMVRGASAPRSTCIPQDNERKEKMTNLEAFKARVIEECEDPIALRGIRWLVSTELAQEIYENYTLKDMARMVLDGMSPISEYSPEELTTTMVDLLGIDVDEDTGEQQQIAIEAFWSKIEEFILGARSK
jgi:hypothetical protein